MPRPTKQYVCVVDGHRRPSMQRNTKGRYRVAARDGKTAGRFLRDAVGFGSVQVLFEDKSPKTALPLGQCRKELNDGTLVPITRYDRAGQAGTTA